jgi:hypothetical protein
MLGVREARAAADRAGCSDVVAFGFLACLVFGFGLIAGRLEEPGAG